MSKRMPYTEFRYIYPPRTEMKIKPGPGLVRKMWEKFPGVIGQFKLNGTRNMFYVFPDGSVQAWNRHAEQQKQYDLTPSMKANIAALGLPMGKFHVVDGELLHSKTKTVKDVAYMFDILVFNGEYLLGETYLERYLLLHRLMEDGGKFGYFPQDFTPREGNMYLAENFAPVKWDWMWQMALKVDYCEGMVLKQTNSVSALEPGNTVVNNPGFMLRVRKPTKNYMS